jgi:hypothetical protein
LLFADGGLVVVVEELVLRDIVVVFVLVLLLVDLSFRDDDDGNQKSWDHIRGRRDSIEDEQDLFWSADGSCLDFFFKAEDDNGGFLLLLDSSTSSCKDGMTPIFIWRPNSADCALALVAPP